MPPYGIPGVYIEENERGPRPIEVVPTSTTAFLGETERGPLRPRCRAGEAGRVCQLPAVPAHSRSAALARISHQ
jgi:phage tail sheath protein FI